MHPGETEATKAGVKTIFADVSVTAQTFFLSQGFGIIEAKSNVILGHSAPNFRMQKTLDSKPNAAANQSQPAALGTNSMSSAAGSDR